MSQDLKGKNAIVTGGGKVSAVQVSVTLTMQNLGALIAENLAKRGANVAIHYNSPGSKDETEKTLQKLKDAGVKAVAVQADLSTKAAVDKLFADALAGLGCQKFDFAINTVGKVLKKPLTDISEDEYDAMFNANSKANFFFIQDAAKNLADGGAIISIVTSLLGAFTGFYSTYQGSKAPVEWFTKAAAKE